MTVAQDLLLVATDPDSGKVRLGSMVSDAALGGAALVDLVTSGHLALEGTGRKGRVVVADPTPAPDPDLESALARLRDRSRTLAPKRAVTRLGKGLRKRVLATMVHDRVLERRDARVLGFPVERYDVLETVRRADLVSRVQAVLLQDREADATTGPLVGILRAADLLRLVVDKPDVKAAKARADVVAEGDWASDGVRQAIRDAQAAVTAAAVAASTSAAAGSG